MPVFVRREYKKLQVNSWDLKKWFQTILEQLECRHMELSILLVNDKKIRKLNSKYRKIDEVTDVLSFPQTTQGKPDPVLLGDVVVSVDTAWNQAKKHGISFEEEMVLLIIHGTLHLLGYDHERSLKEAKKMKKMTISLFKIIYPKTILGNTIPF